MIYGKDENYGEIQKVDGSHNNITMDHSEKKGKDFLQGQCGRGKK